jgi:hypothetical protein
VANATISGDNMLTYERLETIAKLLSWTVEEVEASLAELNEGFMVPDVQSFMAGDWEDEDGQECEDGFYCRLSAPGYLDCTEWSGPFETEEEAVAELLRMYGD